jgi:hypothetical protein
MASAALVVLGIILVILGLFGGGNLVIIGMGLLAILGGGILQVAIARRT